MTTIHSICVVAGTLKASRRPVTIAEPSQIVVGTFRRYFSMSHWKSTQLTTETRLTSRAFTPKKRVATINAGTRARLTRHMIFFVDSSLCTWGEPDIFNSFIL